VSTNLVAGYVPNIFQQTSRKLGERTSCLRYLCLGLLSNGPFNKTVIQFYFHSSNTTFARTGSRRKTHRSVIRDINLLFMFDILNQSIVCFRAET